MADRCTMVIYMKPVAQLRTFEDVALDELGLVGALRELLLEAAHRLLVERRVSSVRARGDGAAGVHGAVVGCFGKQIRGKCKCRGIRQSRV